MRWPRYTRIASFNSIIAQREFEIDSHQDDTEALVETRKQELEEEAKCELYDKLGNTLADFQTWPTWTMEKAEDSHTHIYKLFMKVVFKP